MRSALAAALAALALLVAPVAQADDAVLSPQEQRLLRQLDSYGIYTRSGDPIDLVIVGYEICVRINYGQGLSEAADDLHRESNTTSGGLSVKQSKLYVSSAIVNLCPHVARHL